MKTRTNRLTLRNANFFLIKLITYIVTMPIALGFFNYKEVNYHIFFQM